MRLIDADAPIEFIDAGHLRHPGELAFSELNVVNMLNHAPTAYDIDRVMEQLSLERSKAVISLGESKGTAYEFCDRCVLDAYEMDGISVVFMGVLYPSNIGVTVWKRHTKR